MGLLVKTLELQDFRSFGEKVVGLAPATTILCGPNAAGKTNTVEALQLLSAEVVGNQPLLLLDDVMSELDERRREAVTRFARRGVQMVITTTNLGYFSPELLDGAEVVGYGD